MGGSEAKSRTLPLAKLMAPRLPASIARPRLFELIDSARAKAVTWIAGPGGSGKTTLASSYLLKHSLPHLWYQLDPDDADPATFFHYLTLCVKHTFSNDELVLPLFTAEHLADVRRFSRRYFQALLGKLPQGTLIVIDDYTNLKITDHFDELLCSAIYELSGGCRFLVLSRESAPLKLIDSLTNNISTIEWTDVRFTYPETLEMLSNEWAADEVIAMHLHNLTSGWAAAIRLLLEQLKSQGARSLSEGRTSEPVFDFLASEFFDSLPESIRRFLLKSALLPQVTPALATAIGGDANAFAALEDLHNRHLFTYRTAQEPASYHYHPLLKSFLSSQLRASVAAHEYQEIIRATAQLLESHYPEDAIDLYLQATDWQGAIRLLLTHAPNLAAQGRLKLLFDWLNQIPNELMLSNAWLAYWKGVSEIPFVPFNAKATFAQAYAQFALTYDSIGKMLAASSIVDLTYMLRQSLLSASVWIDSIQQELVLAPAFASSIMEARILASLLATLTYMRPEDPRLPVYAKRLLMLTEEELDDNSKLLALAHLAHYYAMVAGDLGVCNTISARALPLLEAGDLSPLNQILWRTLSAPSKSFTAEKESAYATVLPALKLSTDNGFGFLASIAAFYVLVTRLSFDDNEHSQVLFAQMRASETSSQPADLAWLCAAEAQYALRSGENLSAIQWAERAQSIVAQLGAHLTEFDLQCLLAIACAEAAEFERGLGHIHFVRSHRYAESPRIAYEGKLAEAYLYLQMQNIERCQNVLQEALAVGSRHQYLGSWLCWNRRMMSRLCTVAARYRIEADYVSQLIEKRRLLPEDINLLSWPWPVKIYCMGRFSVTRKGYPVVIKKSHQKPLSLLGIVIALGGTNVKAEHICEALWPNAEGDAAASNLTTNLARLRKVIGEDAIISLDGRISINREQCWIDAFAVATYADANLDGQTTTVSEIREIVDLCSGDFLPHENSAWAISFRSALHKKSSRILASALNQPTHNSHIKPERSSPARQTDMEIPP